MHDSIALEKIKEDKKILKIWERSLNDFAFFCKTFFRDEVNSKFSKLHHQIIDLFNQHNLLKVAIAAPRGLGKTTLTKLLICNYILFSRVNYIIYVSNSSDSATRNTESVKQMLRNNELVKKYFGDIRLNESGESGLFTKESWTAFGDICIEPKGSGQQIRGSLWKNHRPGLVIIDDLEKKESVYNEDQRKKLKEWFFSDLLRTEGRYGQRTRFIYIDTIKHEDALLSNLIENPGWESIKLSICDDDFNSNDPNYMTTEEIKKEYEESKKAGEADTFFMELMNIPISKESAVFKRKYFRYFDEGLTQLLISAKTKSGKKDESVQEKINIRKLITVVIVDPAKTVNRLSKDTGIAVASIDVESGKIFVREAVGEMIATSNLYRVIFDFVLKYNADILAVEVTSLHDFISQPIKNYMRRNNIRVNYKEINAVGEKDKRIANLEPYYRLGDIYHSRGKCRKLEDQLCWFPRSKRLDVADALAYIIKVMEEEHIYFDSKEDENYVYENEYRELEILDKMSKDEPFDSNTTKSYCT
jgi:hypothetical protein